MDLTKDLIKGNLSMIVLKLLEAEGEMYGYQLSQRIKEVSKGKLDIKFGSLYPALHKLHADDIIVMRETFEGSRKRIYYSLSPKGKTATATWKQEYLAFFEMMEGIMNLKPAT